MKNAFYYHVIFSSKNAFGLGQSGTKMHFIIMNQVMSSLLRQVLRGGSKVLEDQNYILGDQKLIFLGKNFNFLGAKGILKLSTGLVVVTSSFEKYYVFSICKFLCRLLDPLRVSVVHKKFVRG